MKKCLNFDREFCIFFKIGINVGLVFSIFWPLHISREKGDDAKNPPPKVRRHKFSCLKMSFGADMFFI